MSLTGGGAVAIVNHSIQQVHMVNGCGITALIGSDNGTYQTLDASGFWVPLVNINLTNAQADYATITIQVWNEVYVNAGAGATAHVDMRFTVGGAQKGQAVNSQTSVNGFGTTRDTGFMQVTLSAPADYARGVGFTTVIEHMGTIGGGGAGNVESNIKGITLIGGL